MLTIFSIPKPFKGHNEVIQQNAIKSWLQLKPNCEIIICADDAGTQEMASKYHLRFIPEITRNDFGTPLLSSAFEKAGKIASHPLVCYVNADIILMSDFMSAMKRIHFKNFLMIGKRWNVHITELLDFGCRDWEEKLKRHVIKTGTLTDKWHIDYFVLPRKSKLMALPPFSVGRPYWDNWMVHQARKLNIPVINVSRAVTVVHQAHGYHHIAKPKSSDSKWEGPEGDQNLNIIGNRENLFNIGDANYIMLRKEYSSSLNILPYWNVLTWLKNIPFLGPALISIRNLFRSLYRKWL